MPSFSTRNGSYHHFVVSIIDNADLSESSHGHLLCRFLAITILLMILSSLSMTVYFILLSAMLNDDFIYDQTDETLQSDTQWAYNGFVWIGTAFSTFIIIAMLITATISTPIPFYLTTAHCKFISTTVAFIFTFCFIHTAISLLANKQSSESLQDHIFNSDLPICGVMDCEFWTIQVALQRILITGFSPLLFYMLWFALNELISKCTCSILRSESMKYPNISMQESFTFNTNSNRQNLEMHLLRHRVTSVSEEMSNLPSIQTILEPKLFQPVASESGLGIPYSLLFAIEFGVLWTLNLPFQKINVSVLENGHSFEVIYFCFLCYVAICKFVMKKMAKRIDAVRLKHDERNQVLSLEYSMEWYLSIMYFAWFRVHIAFHVPEWRQFAVVFAMHLSSEIIQSFTRFSGRYYKFKRRIQRFLKSKNGSNRKNGCWRFLEKVWDGDSDLMEWRNRNGLDMTLRLYASMLIAIFQVVLMVVLGRKAFESDYNLHSEYNYWNGVFYGSLVTAVELFYFGSLWIYHWFRNQYDIFSSFTLYVMGMSRGHRVLMFLTFMSAVVPCFFQ